MGWSERGVRGIMDEGHGYGRYGKDERGQRFRVTITYQPHKKVVNMERMTEDKDSESPPLLTPTNYCAFKTKEVSSKERKRIAQNHKYTLNQDLI